MLTLNQLVMTWALTLNVNTETQIGVVLFKQDGCVFRNVVLFCANILWSESKKKKKKILSHGRMRRFWLDGLFDLQWSSVLPMWANKDKAQERKASNSFFSDSYQQHLTVKGETRAPADECLVALRPVRLAWKNYMELLPCGATTCRGSH